MNVNFGAHLVFVLVLGANPMMPPPTSTTPPVVRATGIGRPCDRGSSVQRRLLAARAAEVAAVADLRTRLNVPVGRPIAGFKYVSVRQRGDGWMEAVVEYPARGNRVCEVRKYEFGKNVVSPEGRATKSAASGALRGVQPSDLTATKPAIPRRDRSIAPVPSHGEPGPDRTRKTRNHR